jgi:hypothetical protein
MAQKMDKFVLNTYALHCFEILNLRMIEQI